MLSCSSFREKGVERIISPADGFVTWHLTVRLNSMFQAVELPTSITNLGTSLANMDGDTLTLVKYWFICYNLRSTIKRQRKNLHFFAKWDWKILNHISFESFLIISLGKPGVCVWSAEYWRRAGHSVFQSEARICLSFPQIQPQIMLKICLYKNIQKSKFHDRVYADWKVGDNQNHQKWGKSGEFEKM